MRQVDFSQQKKATALKNFRYNRFLFLRYSLAGFFFMNIYWALALALSHSRGVWLPVLLLLLALPAIAEQVKLYGEPTDDIRGKLTWSQRYQRGQMLGNLVAGIAVSTTVGFDTLYPFLTLTMEARLLMGLVLVVGMLLAGFALRKIQRIYQQKDKHFYYIQEFIKVNQ